VTNYDGDLDDYRRTVLSARGAKVAAREREPEPGGQSDAVARRPRERRIPLKQRISEAETEMARISGIIEKIDAALALPDLFTRDPKQAAQLSKARASAADALARVEEEWLAASSEQDEKARQA
jgi:ATP-binding cassette subfamily F protein 3